MMMNTLWIHPQQLFINLLQFINSIPYNCVSLIFFSIHFNIFLMCFFILYRVLLLNITVKHMIVTCRACMWHGVKNNSPWSMEYHTRALWQGPYEGHFIALLLCEDSLPTESVIILLLIYFIPWNIHLENISECYFKWSIWIDSEKMSFWATFLTGKFFWSNFDEVP